MAKFTRDEIEEGLRAERDSGRAFWIHMGCLPVSELAGPEW